MENLFKWNNINSKLPDTRCVMLCSDPTDEVMKIKVGALITTEKGEKGWFIGNNALVVTLRSLSYWTYVLETDITVPQVQQDSQLKSIIPPFIQKLRKFEQKFQILGVQMMTPGSKTYPLDLYITGILSRASSLIYGFETLITSANYLAAAHLVRPHLDNYLRLLAGWLVENPHDFANRVWNGEPVRKMKDKNGKLMTDTYLKDRAVLEFPWMKDVYEETSGFIHFSNKHIMNATSVSSKKENTLNTCISKTDYNISNQSKLEAIICMIEISNCIAHRVSGWIETKRFD
ncbi:hypothetical protein [Taibaiella chishuiensis]|uniref:Uncharacterized protein n=1 Tax=Taibaiella chishuiensis TaxID=1434707 RepID=A0A2P8D0S9_9BACT|nr:hypothetical protein [Taibaiella chishuiensis]PSK90833.1 hypothetical protein B0I18_107245 [Taibaiella chishuiensis]